MIEIKILNEVLDISDCIKKAESGECGAIVNFIGTVRNQTAAKNVIRLEYEAYAPMAIKELHKIALEAIGLWKVSNMVIHHRVGILNVGDIAVVIAISTPHRGAAFDACQFVIDQLKKTVPIWKKEIFDDGEEWVSAHA